MRVASVCSGIGGAELAFAGLAEHVFMAEIEPFPRAVLAHHFPHIELHGDFTKIPAARPVDVLVGGTPCQSFSIAGLRRGMADERGNLALEFLRLAERLRAGWVLWENVPGVLSSNGGRDFGSFLGGLAELGYGWAYRVLDAQFFGLAQRRKRVFVVGCLGDWRRAAAVLFEPASVRGDSAPSREARKTAPTLPSRSTAGGGQGTDLDCDGGLIANTLRVPSHGATWRGDGADNLLAFGGNRQSGALEVATAVSAHGGPHGRLDFETETFITHSLRADGFDASEDGTGRGTPLVTTHSLNGAHSITEDGTGRGIPLAFQYKASAANSLIPSATTPAIDVGKSDGLSVAHGSMVRRLTPRECERLQGFPDDWTAVVYRGKRAADGPRYRALGNAFAVPVVRWIARRISREAADIRQEIAA